MHIDYAYAWLYAHVYTCACACICVCQLECMHVFIHLITYARVHIYSYQLKFNEIQCSTDDRIRGKGEYI